MKPDKSKPIQIKITISGPQGSGKTYLLRSVRRSFMRARSQGKIKATRISFRELQT
jgi:Ni2+-binding GTPase involved in maturation of urease and hydrogenase